MSTAFVIIFVVIATIIFVIVFLNLKAKRWNFQGRTLAQAIPAEATIIRLERAGSQSEGDSKVWVKLTLEVRHPVLPVYHATTLWAVDILAIPQVQPRQVVQVKVNAHHPDRVYPDMNLAEFIDWKMTDYKSGLPPEIKSRL